VKLVKSASFKNISGGQQAGTTMPGTKKRLPNYLCQSSMNVWVNKGQVIYRFVDRDAVDRTLIV
jgi:hypothetical protein